MKINQNMCSVVLLAACGMLTFSAHGIAQNYPAKPVRIIVPVAAGGGTDVQARALAALSVRRSWPVRRRMVTPR